MLNCPQLEEPKIKTNQVIIEEKQQHLKMSFHFINAIYIQIQIKHFRMDRIVLNIYFYMTEFQVRFRCCT